jgi:hypothetical protein
MASKGLFEPSLCWDQVSSPTFPPEFGFLVLAETLNLMTFCYAIPLTFFCFLPYTIWKFLWQMYLKKPESIPESFGANFELLWIMKVQWQWVRYKEAT